MLFRFAVQIFFVLASASSTLPLLLLNAAEAQDDADQARRTREIASVTRLGSTPTPAVPGQFLIVYRNAQVPSNASTAIDASGAYLHAQHGLLGISVVEALSDSARLELARDPNIEAIVPDILLDAHRLKARPFPAIPFTADAIYHSPQGWAIRQVGGFGADGISTPSGPWNTTRGKGVRIALLDSGVDPNHADIAPNLALNLSEVNQKTLPSPCDDGSPVDQQGHGTWTASLAAGALGANTGLIAGVAPEATILNIKVLQRMPGIKSPADPTGCLDGQASGLLSWVIQGIEDALASRADIISMSLGALVDITTGDGAGQQAVFNRATQAAFNAGIVLVAAAGNDAYNFSNGRMIELPAQSRNVLAIVASTNPLCAENLDAGATCLPGPVTLPFYSNFGGTLDALTAPGGSYPAGGAADPARANLVPSGWIAGACSSGIVSTLSGVPSDSAHSLGCFNLGHAAYVQAMGTSASAPLVAGAAALLLAAHPTWTPAAVIEALRASAIPATTSMPVPQVDLTTLLAPRQYMYRPPPGAPHGRTLRQTELD